MKVIHRSCFFKSICMDPVNQRINTCIGLATLLRPKPTFVASDGGVLRSPLPGQSVRLFYINHAISNFMVHDFLEFSACNLSKNKCLQG